MDKHNSDHFITPVSFSEQARVCLQKSQFHSEWVSLKLSRTFILSIKLCLTFRIKFTKMTGACLQND